MKRDDYDAGLCIYPFACVCVCVCVYCTMIERRLTTLPSLDHNQSIVLSFCFEGNKMLIFVASMIVGAVGNMLV